MISYLEVSSNAPGKSGCLDAFLRLSMREIHNLKLGKFSDFGIKI